jgi:nucleotide-binding universal stress UspA family protein
MLKKIVVGIDDRPGSRDAAALGEALARATGADLLLVAVYRDPCLAFPPRLGHDAHPERDARERLAAVRPVDAPSAHTTTVADYSAARALRRVARDHHADLLVLGSTRGARLGVAAAGRTGRQVLHDAPCGVAIAAAGLADHPEHVLEHVVTGLNATPEARLALALAEAVAAGGRSTITAVAVADDRLPLDAHPLGMVAELGNWDDIIELRRKHLTAEVEELVAGHDALERRVRVGDPAEALAEAAADEDAGLLVIGSRSWGRVDRIALGSVAEALGNGAPCSLLVVPRPAADAPPPATEALRGRAAAL